MPREYDTITSRIKIMIMLTHPRRLLTVVLEGNVIAGSAAAALQPSAPLRHNVGKDLKRFP